MFELMMFGLLIVCTTWIYKQVAGERRLKSNLLSLFGPADGKILIPASYVASTIRARSKNDSGIMHMADGVLASHFVKVFPEYADRIIC